jgi:hypothetical protein
MSVEIDQPGKNETTPSVDGSRSIACFSRCGFYDRISTDQYISLRIYSTLGIDDCSAGNLQIGVHAAMALAM